MECEYGQCASRDSDLIETRSCDRIETREYDAPKFPDYFHVLLNFISKMISRLFSRTHRYRFRCIRSARTHARAVHCKPKMSRHDRFRCSGYYSFPRGALLITLVIVYTNRLYCGDNAGRFFGRTVSRLLAALQRTVQYNRTTIGRCPMTAKSFRRGRWRECNLNSIRGRITRPSRAPE